VGTVVAVGLGLATWKYRSIQKSAEAAANTPEPMETITVATAQEREHRRSTTAIGTVIALRSITLRNELAGTVSEVMLAPGQIVNAGDLLVKQDTSVEEAELRAQEAQGVLAETMFDRAKGLREKSAVSEEDVDKAQAERDIAQSHIARTKAIIARKTIRAPFKARVGLADVHPGQYLNEGTQLTTLQGVDETAHVDFTVAQRVAAALHDGDTVEVISFNDAEPITAKIVAIDSRVDRATRNAWVRARVDAAGAPAPGASVRVRVPVGPQFTAVAIPVSALRRGPSGDNVFVIGPGHDGKPRAQLRTVESGMTLGDEVLIYKGLNPGEQVAASGSFKLREGSLVAIAPPANANTAK
jgi:membrane fusion protein (multidrug efflux system)